MEVVLWILNCEHYSKCKFSIFSDSLSVLTSIKESCSQSRPTLLNDLLCLIGCLRNPPLLIRLCTGSMDSSRVQEMDGSRYYQRIVVMYGFCSWVIKVNGVALPLYKAWDLHSVANYQLTSYRHQGSLTFWRNYDNLTKYRI